MPKQTIKLSKFSGGINTVDSNRALADDQTPFAKNCDVSKEGRIGILGNALTSYGNINDATAVGDPGYGLFVFSHDYDMLQNGNGNAGAMKVPVNVSTTYICKATNTGISVYDKTNGFWYANLIAFDNTDPLPIFYLADGALRVCDANHPDDKVKWLGHIKRSLFNGNLSYNAWFAQDAELFANTLLQGTGASDGTPTKITLRHDSTQDDTFLTDTANTTINIRTTWKADTAKLATWSAGHIVEIWASAIYDSSRQEGPLVHVGQMGAPPTVGEATTSSLKLGVGIDITADPSAVLDPRMVGIKIYYSNNLDAVETAYQLAEVDFAQGIKKSGGTDFIAFGSYGTVYSTGLTSGGWGVLEFIDPPFAGTYDSKNGHYSSEETRIAFKSAVVVGRRCYAGNIAFQKSTSGNTFTSDQMVKSAFNQFDKFPEFNSSTTAVNDGDDIVALVDIGDQLLQFKRTTLYILNITETGESVEAKHDFRGISRPCHVTKTPMGVMWINATGLHLYGGEGEIQNLIRGKISTEVWNFSDNMSLGYNDEYSKIIVAKDVNIYNSATNPDAGDALVFDLKSMSWMEGGKILSDIGNKTNFQTTPEGDIIYAIDGTKTGYLSTTSDVTFKFYGKLKKYSTAFSSQAWEQSQYPWKLLPNDTFYTDGNRDVAPFRGVERTIIDWQNDNHFMQSNTSWTGGDAQYSAGTPVFKDYDRFTIGYADATTAAEDVDGNVMFDGETFYCVPIAVNGNIGTNVTNLSICPAGKTSLGTTLNRLREIVGSVMANNTNGEGAKTFDGMIAASAVDSTFASYAVSGGAVWSISLDTPGNTDIDAVAFSLSVTVDPTTALTVTGASILQWSDQPTNSENFRYYTRDIDFGSSSAGKRISKTYITYRSVSSRDALDDVPIPTNSNVHPMLHLTTDTGLYTVLPDVTNSTNYSATLGLLGDTNDWMKADIKWKKKDINNKDVPSVIQSAQLVLYRDPALNDAALVVGGFEISDISFSFRMRAVK